MLDWRLRPRPCRLCVPAPALLQILRALPTTVLRYAHPKYLPYSCLQLKRAIADGLVEVVDEGAEILVDLGNAQELVVVGQIVIELAEALLGWGGELRNAEGQFLRKVFKAFLIAAETDNVRTRRNGGLLDLFMSWNRWQSFSISASTCRSDLMNDNRNDMISWNCSTLTSRFVHSVEMRFGIML